MTVADTDSEFDTLACAQTLKEASVEEKQAKAHTRAARTIRAGLATKTDLDARISGLETRMLRVAIAIVLAQTALIVALGDCLTAGPAVCINGLSYLPCADGASDNRRVACLQAPGPSCCRCRVE